MPLQLIHTNGLQRAYAVEGPGAKGYKAYITSVDYRSVPRDLESDEMFIEVYPEGCAESIFSLKARGRKGLRDWYVTHVGHDPDGNGEPVPIRELVAAVAMRLLIRLAQ